MPQSLYCLVLDAPDAELMERIKSLAPEHYEVSERTPVTEPSTWMLIQSDLAVDDLSEALGLNKLADDDTAVALLKLNGARAGYFYQTMWNWLNERSDTI